MLLFSFSNIYYWRTDSFDFYWLSWFIGSIHRHPNNIHWPAIPLSDCKWYNFYRSRSFGHRWISNKYWGEPNNLWCTHFSVFNLSKQILFPAGFIWCGLWCWHVLWSHDRYKMISYHCSSKSLMIYYYQSCRILRIYKCWNRIWNCVLHLWYRVPAIHMPLRFTLQHLGKAMRKAVLQFEDVL